MAQYPYALTAQLIDLGVVFLFVFFCLLHQAPQVVPKQLHLMIRVGHVM